MFFRVMIEGPQTDMNMDILRDVGLISCFGWEVDELDSGELEVVMERSVLEFSGRGRIDDLNPFIYPTLEATPSG
jgi:hypothetical protein